MQPSSKKIQTPKKLITLPPSEESNKLIFSYEIRESISTVVLTQRETNYSLTMKMKKLEDVLRISSFNLLQTPHLEKLSIALYDAASIEIALEALKLLFSYANKQTVLEIFFTLPQEEANHLTAFEGFIDTCTPQITNEGKRVNFSLYCLPQIQAQLFTKSESIKRQVHHELWKMQREDAYLKDYLQNNKRGKLLPECQLLAEESRPVQATILSFPPRKNK